MSQPIKLNNTTISISNPKILKIFPFFKDNIEDEPSLITINYDKKIFDMILEFAEYYDSLDGKQRKYMNDIKNIALNKARGEHQRSVLNWYKGWVEKFTNHEDITNLIKISDEMGNDTLLGLSCLILSNDIKTLDVESFRNKYSIKCDFTDEDVEQLNKEDEILEKTLSY